MLPVAHAHNKGDPLDGDLDNYVYVVLSQDLVHSGLYINYMHSGHKL